MSEHTPGQWTASGNGIHVGTRCVATTHMEPREQRTADAKLIAAAPDMLEALRALRAYAIPGMDWSDDAGKELLKMADEAIAKASA